MLFTLVVVDWLQQDHCSIEQQSHMDHCNQLHMVIHTEWRNRSHHVPSLERWSICRVWLLALVSMWHHRNRSYSNHPRRLWMDLIVSMYAIRLLVFSSKALVSDRIQISLSHWIEKQSNVVQNLINFNEIRSKKLTDHADRSMIVDVLLLSDSKC